MHIIDVPTEQTTALTDLLMGLFVAVVFFSLYRLRNNTNKQKVNIWRFTFGFLFVASLIGVIAHGVAMSPELYFWLWQPINLALGLAIAMFVLATVYDTWGEVAYRKVRIPMIVVAIIFYVITVLLPGTFLTFVAYEAIAMLFALGGYLYLAFKNKLKGAWWMVVGILLTIIAAVVQAVGQNGDVIFWGLDHNGVFHLMQMFGVVALWFGLKESISMATEVLHRAAI